MPLGLNSYRPPMMGTTHMVSSGHYLAAAAGYRILEQGGNAIDAGVASGIAINVTLPNATNFGGVAPIIVYEAATDSVVTISGLGRWPKAASIDYFNRHAGGQIPLGVLRTVMPAAADAWLTALERYGTMSFEQVVTPALELAEQGHPLSRYVHAALPTAEESHEGTAAMWPTTRDIYMPGGKGPQAGELLVQKDLARTFRRLIEAERSSSHSGREAGVRAARDRFYKGDIAREMAAFSEEQGGLLTMQDLEDFSVKVEKPAVGSFREYSVFTCGPWCQGPVVAQTLQMLQSADLAAMGHNSVDYLHLVSQALNLAYSDREHYYGDPEHVEVPIGGLLSEGYTTALRNAIDMGSAFAEMPPPGDPWAHQGETRVAPRAEGGSVWRRGATPGHQLHMRRGPVRERLLGHAQRPAGGQSYCSGAGYTDVFSGLAKLARPGTPVQPPAVEAPAADPQPCHRLQERQALHALRYPRRRRPVHRHGADVPQHRGVRYGPAGGDRAAPDCTVELPQLLLAAHLPSRRAEYRGQDSRGDKVGAVAPAATGSTW